MPSRRFLQIVGTHAVIVTADTGQFPPRGPGQRDQAGIGQRLGEDRVALVGLRQQHGRKQRLRPRTDSHALDRRPVAGCRKP